MKEVMPQLAEFLSEIMNTLLDYDIFPDKLKIAQVWHK